MSEGDISKRIMDGAPEGRRGVGRPKLRWLDGVWKDASETGTTPTVMEAGFAGDQDPTRAVEPQMMMNNNMILILHSFHEKYYLYK